MDDLDMYELQAKSARGEKLDQVQELRLELYEKVAKSREKDYFQQSAEQRIEKLQSEGAEGQRDKE